MGKKQYVACTESDIPSGVRFDVPARYAGQIVEVSFGGYGRAEQDVGAPYKMVVDRSEPIDSPDRVTYYRVEVVDIR